MPAGRSKVLERVPQILQARTKNRHRDVEAFSVNPLNRYTPPLGTNFEDVSSIRGQPRVDQTMLLQLLDLQCKQGLRRAVCCPKPVNYASRKRLTLTVLRCQDVSESN